MYGRHEGEDFYQACVGDEQTGRSFFFYTKSMIDELPKENVDILADGTHKYFPNYFSQLYVINVMVGSYVS